MNLAEKTVECLNRYSTTITEQGTKLKHELEKSRNQTKILPVVGVQGMGKSTLLDALLGKQILPVEADETTCVPVEVKYGTTERAIVHLYNVKKELASINNNSLAEFVDNRYNPGNEKQVQKIELFYPSQLLKDGLILVDLPGVGSLTKENEETTKKYLQSALAAIFVIAITPPIRKRDAIYIKMFWQQFREAIFVQNDWEESEEEVASGTEHNQGILTQCAKEINSPFSPDMLITVNAYNALTAAHQNNQEMLKLSNLGALVNKIKILTESWEKILENNLKQKIQLCIISALGEAKRRLKSLNEGQAQQQLNKRKRLQEYKNVTLDLKEKIIAIQSNLFKKIIELEKQFTAEAQKTTENIRSQVYGVIDAGTVDGHYLKKSFENIQTVELEKFAEAVITTVNEFQKEIKEDMEELAQIVLAEKMRIQQEQFNLKDEFKYEKGIKAAFTIGGVAGAYFGASTLAGLFMSTPPGWIVAAVGVAICGVASLLGFGVSDLILSRRKMEAKKAINKPLDNMQQKLTNSCKENLSKVSDNIKNVLLKILADREEEEKNLEAALNTPVSSTDAQSLQDDITYLKGVYEHV